MAATVLGNQGTSLIFISRSRTLSDSGETIVDTYRCDKDSADTLIAAGAQFGDGHSLNIRSRLQAIDHEVGQKFSTIRYRYAPKAAGGGGGAPIPDDVSIARASANAMEIPISLHASWVATWDDTKKGVDSYLSPQPTMSYTYTEKNYNWTQASVIGSVGKRQTPLDGNGNVLSGAVTANWLCIGHEVWPIGDGEDANVTDTWQYASAGWDSDIYSDA